MKILFYQNTLRNHEIISDSVHIVEVLNNLVKLGHEVIFVDGKYHTISSHILVKKISEPSPLESYWGKIKELVRNSPFRGEALVVFLLLKEMRLLFSAFITTLHDKPDLVYRRHNMFASECILSKIIHIPSVMEINGIVADEVEVQSRGDHFSVWMIRKIEKWSFRFADEYITVTPKLKEVLNEDYKINKDKIIVIENGANTDLFKPLDSLKAKRELNLKSESSFICFVGGLEIWHGVNLLVSAFPQVLSEFPKARALIIGEGPQKNALIKQTVQLGISDKIIFIGKVPYENVPLYVNASEICVAPFSTDRCLRIGSSSLKLCEYLACGKPVVSSKISGLEYLEEKKLGFLTNVGNGEELAQYILRLLRDPFLRKQMGEKGRKYVLENRSWESVTNQVADICKKLLRNTINIKE